MAETKNDRAVLVRLPPETVRRLDASRQKDGLIVRSRSMVIRTAIIEYLERFFTGGAR